MPGTATSTRSSCTTTVSPRSSSARRPRTRICCAPASSRVIALAQDAGLAVVPRGTGSSLELGHPPSRVDVVLDLADLDRVIEYNPDDLTITVQAGMAAGTLAALLAPHRQWLPIDPPGI